MLLPIQTNGPTLNPAPPRKTTDAPLDPHPESATPPPAESLPTAAISPRRQGPSAALALPPPAPEPLRRHPDATRKSAPQTHPTKLSPASRPLTMFSLIHLFP